MERRGTVNYYGMKKNYERVRFFEWISWQYPRYQESYSMGLLWDVI